MTSAISNESELYLTPGGPIHRLMQRMGIVEMTGNSVARRTIGLIAITWVPMCIFAFLQGNALGPTPRGSFLLDFATYARFFIGVPIFVFAEASIGPRLREAGLLFIRDGHVQPADYPAFEQAIARFAKRRESTIVSFVLIALAAFGAWKLTAEAASGNSLTGWQSVTFPEGHAFRVSLAGLWNHLVAVPIVLFLLYRWLWRLLSWTLFLLDVSKMDLKLVPTHADEAGGLGFLDIAHQSFGILAFGISCVLSAAGAFLIVYEGAKLESLATPVIAILILNQILFLGPLLVFSQIMGRTWRTAMRQYGSLVVTYNREFDQKWAERTKPKAEPLLGSADIQSLADLGNSYRFVSEMNFAPFGKQAVIRIAAATALPFLILPLLAMPIGDIIDVLAKIAF